MILSKSLALLAILGSAFSAPTSPHDTRAYPALTPESPFGDEQPAGGPASDPNEAVYARKARAALIRSESLSHKTWEVSTFYQAKAELYGVTEYNWNPQPFASPQPSDEAIVEATSKIPSLLDIAPDGYLVNSDRGSQADVFSLIPAVWASGKRDAASNMASWLRTKGRKLGDIYSHRGDSASLWSDEGYMIPPVLAFLGLVQNDNNQLGEAIRQWNALADSLASPRGDFVHVPDFDPHTWTSGTGWMLMGLARVLASIEAAGQTSSLGADIGAAVGKAKRALSAALSAQKDDGRIPNYTDKDSSPETSGTAAIAAAFYRLASLKSEFADADLAQRAEKAYRGVMAQVGEDGVVNGSVDPSGANFNNAGTNDSPEGHAFVALMWAARREWIQKGGKPSAQPAQSQSQSQGQAQPQPPKQDQGQQQGQGQWQPPAGQDDGQYHPEKYAGGGQGW